MGDLFAFFVGKYQINDRHPAALLHALYREPALHRLDQENSPVSIFVSVIEKPQMTKRHRTVQAPRFLYYINYLFADLSVYQPDIRTITHYAGSITITNSRLVRPHSVPRLTSDHPKANVSATYAVPFAQLAVVDPDGLRRPPALPFLARQSSRNGPVQLGRRFSEDRLPALLVEDDDATYFRWRRGASLLPSEQ